MERQAGLGRSLEDVLDSLAPVEADPGAPGRVLFEPRDLERQVDQLAAEIGDVRERVQRLVGQVSDATVANGTTNGTHEETGDSEGDSQPAAMPAAEAPGPPEELGRRFDPRRRGNRTIALRRRGKVLRMHRCRVNRSVFEGRHATIIASATLVSPSAWS